VDGEIRKSKLCVGKFDDDHDGGAGGLGEVVSNVLKNISRGRGFIFLSPPQAAHGFPGSEPLFGRERKEGKKKTKKKKGKRNKKKETKRERTKNQHPASAVFVFFFPPSPSTHLPFNTHAASLFSSKNPKPQTKIPR
jgi:hypothetical protein